MCKEGRSADARPVRRPFQSRPGPLQDDGAGRHMGQGSYFSLESQSLVAHTAQDHRAPVFYFYFNFFFVFIVLLESATD